MKKNMLYFGTIRNDDYCDEEEFGFDDSRRSNSARLTQGWLEEARHVLASSPKNSNNNNNNNSSSSSVVGSPRFASSSQGRIPLLMSLDRRDPLSRSARRNKSGESLGDEILSKSSTKHTSNSITSPSSSPSSHDHGHGSDNIDQLRPRKSRFQIQMQNQTHPNSTNNPNFTQISPRSFSSSSSSFDNAKDSIINQTPYQSLNNFLKHQRTLLFRILNKELPNVKANIILFGPCSNSATSMVTAICYAWLLSYKHRKEGGAAMAAMVPVMNMRRDAMWKMRQISSLFHHTGLDAIALVFSDEVDLETLKTTRQLSITVVGQDILCDISKVGSQCTILTDLFYKEAYELLQNSLLKKLLLGAILLDTKNLKASTTVKDEEAVRLLLVGSAKNYRCALYDQCECKTFYPIVQSYPFFYIAIHAVNVKVMQDHKAGSFVEVLTHNNGKPPKEDAKSQSESQGFRGKSKFFFARLFGFGS